MYVGSVAWISVTRRIATSKHTQKCSCDMSPVDFPGTCPSCETTAVIARFSEIKTTMYWSLLCGKKMAAFVDESIDDH